MKFNRDATLDFISWGFMIYRQLDRARISGNVTQEIREELREWCMVADEYFHAGGFTQSLSVWVNKSLTCVASFICHHIEFCCHRIGENPKMFFEDQKYETILVDEIRKETDLAMLCIIDGGEYWIPFSQVENDSLYKVGETEVDVTMTHWIARQKGLV